MPKKKDKATPKEEKVTFEELQPLNDFQEYIRGRIMNSPKFSLVYLYCVACFQNGLKATTAPELEHKMHIGRDLAWKYLELLTRNHMMHKVVQGRRAIYSPKEKINQNDLIKIAKKTAGVQTA